MVTTNYELISFIFKNLKSDTYILEHISDNIAKTLVPNIDKLLKTEIKIKRDNGFEYLSKMLTNYWSLCQDSDMNGETDNMIFSKKIDVTKIHKEHIIIKTNKYFDPII
jgi:hypothetical protein